MTTNLTPDDLEKLEADIFLTPREQRAAIRRLISAYKSALSRIEELEKELTQWIGVAGIGIPKNKRGKR